jgi:hypothetical protein
MRKIPVAAGSMNGGSQNMLPLAAGYRARSGWACGEKRAMSSSRMASK